MNRKPVIGERVQVIGLEGYEPQNMKGAYCKVDGIFLDTVYLKPFRKKNKIEVDLNQIVYLEPPKPDTLSQEERVSILKRIVKAEYFTSQSIGMEIAFLNRLVKDNPNLGFWRNGFNPDYQVKSMIWWISGGKDQLHTMYQLFTTDINKPKENLIQNLQKEKIGEDIVLTKKPKSLIDLFAK